MPQVVYIYYVCELEHNVCIIILCYVGLDCHLFDCKQFWNLLEPPHLFTAYNSKIYWNYYIPMYK